MALDLGLSIRGLVQLRQAPLGGPLLCANLNGCAVGIEPMKRLSRGQGTDRIDRILNARFHLQHRSAQLHFDL